MEMKSTLVTAKTLIATSIVLGTMTSGQAFAGTTQVKCMSYNGHGMRQCNLPVSNIKGVKMAAKHSAAACAPGQNWGRTNTGVWVNSGCGATFNVYHGKLSQNERNAMRNATGSNGQRTASHYQGSNNSGSDGAKGLLVLGGLLVAGSILAEIFDGNDSSQVTHHKPQPVANPVWNPGYIQGGHVQVGHNPNQGLKKGKRKAIKTCSTFANSSALKHGYIGSEIIKVKDVSRSGNRKWVVSGLIKTSYKERVRRKRHNDNNWGHNSGYSNNGWGNDSWNSGSNNLQWNIGWGSNFGNQHQRNKPRFVVKSQTAKFKCMIKGDKVRSFSSW